MKHNAARQRRHTLRKNRTGGWGVHHAEIIWCKHPLQKKIKKSKTKNQKFSSVKIYKENRRYQIIFSMVVVYTSMW